MNFKKTVVALAMLAAGTAASAAPLFQDDFNGETAGLNTTPSQWDKLGGAGAGFDIIGAGTPYDYVSGNGLYVDLIGGTGKHNSLAVELELQGGIQYVASFQLAGNNVGSLPYSNQTQSVSATFGGTAGVYSLGPTDGFGTYSLTFTPTTTGFYALSFRDTTSASNAGALLDNVNVTAVPEPESYAMMLAGLGALGFMARRRRQGK